MQDFQKNLNALKCYEGQINFLAAEIQATNARLQMFVGIYNEIARSLQGVKIELGIEKREDPKKEEETDGNL